MGRIGVLLVLLLGGGGAATAGSLRTRTAALGLTLLVAGRILSALRRLLLARTALVFPAALAWTVARALALALARGARASFVLRTVVAIRHGNLLVLGEEKSPAIFFFKNRAGASGIARATST
jgi:hypothetical protein